MPIILAMVMLLISLRNFRDLYRLGGVGSALLPISRNKQRLWNGRVLALERRLLLLFKRLLIDWLRIVLLHILNSLERFMEHNKIIGLHRESSQRRRKYQLMNNRKEEGKESILQCFGSLMI